MTKDTKTEKVSPKNGRPNQIGLGHELIHADRSMRGVAIDYSKQERYSYINSLGKTTFQIVPAEELATVGLSDNANDDNITENQLRSEQGVDSRGAY